jgi:hypothetical protein
MKHMTEISIERLPADEGSFSLVFEMMLELYAVVGVAPLNSEKYAKGVWGVMQEGMTFLARDAAGNAVGTIGLIETRFWYSDWTYLQDKWFYVRPSFRGHAGLALLRAVRKEAEEKDRIAYVWNTNPDRKQKALPFGVEAQRLGFVPFGFMTRVSKKSSYGGADVLRIGERADDHNVDARLHQERQPVPGVAEPGTEG